MIDRMQQRLVGQFISDGSYRGLLIDSDHDRRPLNNVLDAAFPKGSIVQVTIVADLVGHRDLCQKRNKYSTCNEVLNADGTCPDVERHEPDPEPEPEEPRFTWEKLTPEEVEAEGL